MTANAVVNVLVAATDRSSPAAVTRACAATRASGEPASFVSAAVSAPRPAANSSAATISGVSPDCETPSTSARERSTGGR